MPYTEVVIQGTLNADGTLQLDEKPAMVPGRVQVILQPVPELPTGDPFWDMMKDIWAGQKARGFVPRTAEEVEAERRQLRDEWEDRQQSLQRIQDESRRLREQQP